MINIDDYDIAYEWWFDRYGDDPTVSFSEYLLSQVARLTALLRNANHRLDLMVERFGIEALVEMVGEEE